MKMMIYIKKLEKEMITTEVGIYKRKQESKKTRKYAFDQKRDQEKKEKPFFFLGPFLG